MTDVDLNYLTNADISTQFYNGETVPSDATIKESVNLGIKNRIDGILMSFVTYTSYVKDTPATKKTDTYGDFREAAFILYDQIKSGEQPSMDKLKKENKDLWFRLKNRNKSPAFAGLNPKTGLFADQM